MPSYKNFTATILDSNSHPLQEYMTSHNPLTNVCQTYIQSHPNQPFVICLRDDSLAQSPMFTPHLGQNNPLDQNVLGQRRNDGMLGREGFDLTSGAGDPRSHQACVAQGTAVYVDGAYVDNGLTGPGIAVERRWYGKRVDHIFVRPFVFKENTSDNTAIWDVGEIGTIHLILRRCTVGSLAQDQTNRGCIPEDIDTPPVRHLQNREDFLAHRVEFHPPLLLSPFSSPREIPATLYHVSWIDNPPTPQAPSYCEFKFIYRSRQVLISQGIIPGPIPHIKREPLRLGDGILGDRGTLTGIPGMDGFETGENDSTDTAGRYGGVMKENHGGVGVSRPTRKRKPRTTKKSKKDTDPSLPLVLPESGSPTPMLPPGSATTAPPSSPPDTNPRAKRSRPNIAKSKNSKSASLNETMEISPQYSGVEMQLLGSGGSESIPSSPIEAAVLRRTTNIFRHRNDSEPSATEMGVHDTANENVQLKGGGDDGVQSLVGGAEADPSAEGSQFEILKELRELREEVKRLKEQKYSTTTENFTTMNPYHILAQPRDQSQYPQRQQHQQQTRENTVEARKPLSETH